MSTDIGLSGIHSAASTSADQPVASAIGTSGASALFSSRRRHTRYWRDWSSDVCSSDLGKILGLDRKCKAVLIGAGNLGQALTSYSGFKNAGFNIEAVFDANPKMIGLKIRDYEIMDSDNLEAFVTNNDIDIAILCIPKNGAQAVADKLVASGVRGIWNFAPIDLEVPNDVIVENVNLTESLFTLSYLMKESDDRI